MHYKGGVKGFQDGVNEMLKQRWKVHSWETIYTGAEFIVLFQRGA